MLDIKLVNGKIIDLEKNKLIEGDVGIKDGKISDIGDILEEAKIILDVKGQIISPGFIDIHIHEEDFALTEKKDYDIAYPMLKMGVTTAAVGNCGNNRQSIEELEEFIRAKGNPINYLSFIGHNYLRRLMGNNDINQKSSAIQIEKMAEHVEKAIEGGAIGISYGLEYCPGIDQEEAIAVCNKVKDRKDILVSMHFRKDSKNAIKSIEEMAEIGKKVKIPLQISHLSSCSGYGNMKESLEKIQTYKNEGLDILSDAYPYAAFSTFIGSEAFDESCFADWEADYSAIMLTEGEYKGVLCDEKLFKQVRAKYPQMLAIANVMKEEDIALAIKHPLVMIASDGLYRNKSGHPRGAGTFPRVLSKYVREEGHIDLLTAINKMTNMPAKRLGLKSKGLVKVGYDADITIFNPDTIKDKADFFNGQASPEGISYVILSGEIVLRDNEVLNKGKGKFIKNPKIVS